MAVPEAKRVWFADDATAVGTIQALMSWWQILSLLEPDYGYFPNALKTVLIVKPHLLPVANAIFGGTNVQRNNQCQHHLGAALGSHEFAEEYESKKVCTWTVAMSCLASITANHPHAAYCAFTHGMIGRWVYHRKKSCISGIRKSPVNVQKFHISVHFRCS